MEFCRNGVRLVDGVGDRTRFEADAITKLGVEVWIASRVELSL